MSDSGHKGDLAKVAKGTGASLAGAIVGRGGWFLCQVFIARHYGPEAFGLFVLGLVVLRVSEIASRMGLDSGGMRFVSIYRATDGPRARGTIISALSMSALAGTAMATALYLAAGYIATSVFKKPALTPIIHAFAFVIPVMCTSYVSSALSRGFHTTKYDVLVMNVIQPMVNLLAVMAVAYAGVGIIGAVYAFGLSYAISSASGIYIIHALSKRLRGEGAEAPVFNTKELLSYCLPLSMLSLLNFMLAWTDTLMLGYLDTSRSVGIYRAASQLPYFLSIMLVASNAIYAPVAADLHKRDERERAARILKITTMWVFYITLPAVMVMVSSSRELMEIFGRDFVAEGAAVMIVLSIGHFVDAAVGGCGYTLSMTGRQHITLMNSSFVLTMNAILNYKLIPIYGALGAAYATGASIGVINIMKLAEVYYFYRMHPYERGYLPAMFSAMAAAAVLYLVRGLGIGSAAGVILLNSLVIIVMFSFALVKLSRRDDSRFIIEKARARFSRRRA